MRPPHSPLSITSPAPPPAWMLPATSPSQSDVASATLSLYQTSEFGRGNGVTMNIFAARETWNETTLSWNSQPAYSASKVGSMTTASSQLTWISGDVRQAVALWWQGGI